MLSSSSSDAASQGDTRMLSSESSEDELLELLGRLRLPDVPFVTLPCDGKYVYNRECYGNSYNAIRNQLYGGRRCVRVFGTSGKLSKRTAILSCDADYNILVCVGCRHRQFSLLCSFYDKFRHDRIFHEHQDQDSCIIAAAFHHQKLVGAVVSTGDEEEPRRANAHQKAKELVESATAAAKEAGRKVFLLCDGEPDYICPDVQVVVFSSVDKASLDAVRKDDCSIYMPLWTCIELQNAAYALGCPHDDDEIEEHFNTCGGMCFYVLIIDQWHFSRYKREIQRVVDEMTDRNEIINLLTGKETSTIRRQLLHYKPHKQDSMDREVQLASPFVENLLARRLDFITVVDAGVTSLIPPRVFVVHGRGRSQVTKMSNAARRRLSVISLVRLPVPDPACIRN